MSNGPVAVDCRCEACRFPAPASRATLAHPRNSIDRSVASDICSMLVFVLRVTAFGVRSVYCRPQGGPDQVDEDVEEVDDENSVCFEDAGYPASGVKPETLKIASAG